MAKKQIKNYVFLPGAAGVGKIKVLDKIDQESILLITNTTDNTTLYNFGDGSKKITTTFQRVQDNQDPDFPYATSTSEGITHIIFQFDTSTQSSTDNLQIFVEAEEAVFRPYKFGTDAIERMRIAAPQSMIDADFEYGLQPTKWQTIDIQRGYPSIFEIPGSETTIDTITTDASSATSGIGDSLITVTTVVNHDMEVGQPIRISGTDDDVTGSSRANGSFIISDVPYANQFTYYAKGRVGTTNGESIKSSYTSLKKGGFYTGAEIGTPTFTVESQGSSGTVYSFFNLPAGSNRVAYGGTGGAVVGSPLSGTGIANGTQVTGLTGVTTTKTVNTDVFSGQNSIILDDTATVAVGAALSTNVSGVATALFVTNIVNNTLSLSGPLQESYLGGSSDLGQKEVQSLHSNGSGALFDVTRRNGHYAVALTNISKSITGTSGTTIIGVNNITNLLVGMTVSGSSIGAGTTIVGLGTNTVEISQGTSGAVSTANFSNPGVGYTTNDRIRLSGNFLGGGLNNDCIVRVVETGAGGSISSISSSKVVTPVSTAKISTAQAKTGGSSLLLNGTSDGITITDAITDVNYSELYIGDNDFSIDFWIYRNRISVAEVLVDARTTASTDVRPHININANNNVVYGVGGNTRITGTTQILASTWTHIAVSRNSGTTRLFVNGVEDGTDTTNDTFATAASYVVTVGKLGYGASGYASAYIDNFRMTYSYGRFASAFDASALAISNDVYNSVLCNFRGLNNATTFQDDSKGRAILSSAIYTNVQGLSSQNGSGATYTITRSGGGSSTYSVTQTSGGSGYVATETITVDGSVLGGVSTVNDLTITVNTVDANGTVLTSSANGTASDGYLTSISMGDFNNKASNSGTGLEVSVSRGNGVYGVTVDTAGTGYYPEYQEFIPGNQLGGQTPANDLTLTTNNLSTSAFGAVNSVSVSGTPIAADSITFYPSLTLSEPTTATIADDTAITFSSIASIGCTFASNHGLTPGSPVFVTVGSSGQNHDLVGGPRIIESIPELDKIVFKARSAGQVGAAITGEIYTRPDCFYIHRPFDGGVLLGTGSPTHGVTAVRQSKKYLRYQSGKGIMFTTGTLMAPSYDLRSGTSNGTAVGSIVTFITDDVEHGLQAGAEIIIKGFSTSGYNGHYEVQTIVDEYTFTVLATETLGATNALLADQPQVSLYQWKGSTVRAGAFDDQNGIYWQYDGINLSIGLRSSTYQIAGTIAVNTDSNTVTGTNTRFREQLIAGNKIVIRGMTHTVTHIASNTELTVTPDFRGVNNVSGVKAALIKDILIPQSQWNLDRGDGTGPSGYKIEVNKMQMYGFQYSWYGAGFIDWMLRGPNGDYLYVHRLKNNNRNTEAFMRSGNLPVRYEVINEGAKTKLTAPVGTGSTTLSIDDVRLLPTAGSLYIDNEIINYTGVTTATNTLTGITREGTYSNYYSGSTRTYSAGIATDHSSGTGAILLSNTATPIISHWGSAYLTDGLFDTDRGYIFNYQATGFDISTVKQTAFLIRLSPSVSNAILGDLGERELINRAQLLLKGLEFTATGGTATQGVVIEGVLNPQNYPTNPDDVEWFPLNNVSVGGQPSFAQIADGTRVTWPGAVTTYQYTNSLDRNFKSTWVPFLASEAANLRVGMQVSASGLKGGTTIRKIESYTFQSGGQTHRWVVLTNRVNAGTAGSTQFTFTTVDNRAIPGETIFSFIGSGGGGNATQLDLSDLKELNNTPIGGRGAFPNGPDVLAINVYTTDGSDFTGNLVLRWSEAQA